MQYTPANLTLVSDELLIFKAAPLIVMTVPPDLGPYSGNTDSTLGTAYTKCGFRNELVDTIVAFLCMSTVTLTAPTVSDSVVLQTIVVPARNYK